MNFYNAGQMVFYSLYYRQLAFGEVKVVARIQLEGSRKSRWTKWLRVPCSSLLSGLSRAISVRGGWFDDVLLLREVAEIASQTVQAHSSSLCINSIWVNQVFAVLIFFNAIFNTLVHKMLKEEVGWRRFICTAIDLAIDLMWGFILPGKIIVEYFTLFVRNNYQLPYEFSYSDTAIIKAMLECDQFFMTSWLDAVTTALPYLNMLSGLRNIKVLLQHDMDTMMAVSPSARIQPVVPAQMRSEQASAFGPTQSTLSSPLSVYSPVPEHKTSLVVAVRRSWSCRGFMTKSVYVLIPLLGLLVLITSIVASRFWLHGRSECAPGCRLHMYPWFTTHCGCSVLEINCYEYGIEGSEADMDAVLTSLDRRTLNSLIITHCPALTIPPAIQLFPNLLQLEIYNSTVVEWSSDASLSAPFLSRVGAVFIVHSTLRDGIPEGLTHNLSPSVIDIEFIECDLGPGIPDDLDVKWPDVSMLFIEHCALQEFPAVIGRMALTDLSLVGNNISSIPDDLSAELPWMYVFLDSNPLLDCIPDSLSVAEDLEYFSIQATSIASLPEWLHERIASSSCRFFAFDTPFCNASSSADGSHSDDTLALSHCSEPTFATEGVFPLEMKDEERRLRIDPAAD